MQRSAFEAKKGGSARYPLLSGEKRLLHLSIITAVYHDKRFFHAAIVCADLVYYFGIGVSLQRLCEDSGQFKRSAFMPWRFCHGMKRPSPGPEPGGK